MTPDMFIEWGLAIGLVASFGGMGLCALASGVYLIKVIFFDN